MKSITIATTLLAAAMAAPEFKTSTKDATLTPPICTFDPVKGEYICPEDATVKTTPDASSSASSASADAPAADCAKCQADWEKCLTHWGCWFYDCGPACRCQVANNDPQCNECPAGECHA